MDIEIIRSDAEGMRAALAEAQKAFALHEVPIGAVICDASGKIIARGHNLAKRSTMPRRMPKSLPCVERAASCKIGGLAA